MTKSRIWNKFLGMFLLLTFWSCIKHKPTTHQEVTELKDSILLVTDFKYYKAKAKMDFFDGENIVTATVLMKMQKDSCLWFSVVKFGKEAARLKIQPDSSYFIQKYPEDQKFYKILSTALYLQGNGVNLEFESLQNLIFGNYPIKIEGKDLVRDGQETFWIEQEREDATITTELFKKLNKIKKSSIVNSVRKDTLNIEYSDYQMIGDKTIPQKMELFLSQNQDSLRVRNRVILEWSGSEFPIEAPTMNFNIPDNYERR